MALITRKEVINDAGTVINGATSLTSGNSSGTGSVTIPSGRVITSISVFLSNGFTNAKTVAVRIGGVDRFYLCNPAIYNTSTNSLNYIDYNETFYINLVTTSSTAVSLNSIGGASLTSSDLIIVNYYTP